jgi:hypothetical protein
MAEISKKRNWVDWLFRILAALDLFLIINGYIAYYRVQRQLISPLIPKDTVNQVYYTIYEPVIKAGIITAILFLAGLLFYSFDKKTIANYFLGIAAIGYIVWTNWFKS